MSLNNLFYLLTLESHNSPNLFGSYFSRLRLLKHSIFKLTVFRVPENHLQHFQPDEHKMDRVILRALLHGQDLTPVDQLLLTLAWGREDIAKSEIFNKSSLYPSDPDWLIQVNN